MQLKIDTDKLNSLIDDKIRKEHCTKREAVESVTGIKYHTFFYIMRRGYLQANNRGLHSVKKLKKKGILDKILIEE